MTRIAVVVTARASWAKLEPVCRALRSRAGVELQIIACASALLERYGNVSAVIEAQGYAISERVYSVYEGATLLTSVAETGALCTALASTFTRLRPDVVVVMADRHEVLGVAQAAAGLHIPLAHCQGGEVSGSIDDKIRNAVTMLADYHFPCTDRAARRVSDLTDASDRVWNFGCPSIDIAKEAMTNEPVTLDELGGAGADIHLGNGLPLVVWLQHPVTSEAEDAERQAVATATALLRGNYEVLALWPGEDAGADGIAKVLRRNQEFFHTLRNLPPSRFLRLLTQASVLVGNSSAGIRECAYLGVPVINIGNRQRNRERAENVMDVPHDADAIYAAIERQIAHGPYPSSEMYGRGDAGRRIAEVLCRL